MGKKSAAKKAAAAPKKAEAVAEEEASAEVKEAPRGPKNMEPGLAEVDGFLAKGMEMMASDATRALLADPHGRPSAKLIQLQFGLWDELNVDRAKGKAAVEGAERLFPEEKERLAEGKKNFILRSQATYLQALGDRKPATLEHYEPMSRDVIREFCDACNAKASQPETGEAMIGKLEAGAHPDEVLLEMQMDMFETLGFAREHGKACLSKVGTNFPGDKTLHGAIQRITQQGSECVLTACDRHLKAGGQLPDGDRKDSLFIQVCQYRAKEALTALTPQERGNLFEKLQPKAVVFAKLPQENRLKLLIAMPEEEKLETLKGELLLRQVIQSQQASQHMAQQKARQEMIGKMAMQQIHKLEKGAAVPKKA